MGGTVFAPLPTETHTRSTAAGACVAAASYVVSVVFMLSITALSLVASDGEGTTIAGVDLPGDAVCVRVRRGSDYAVALVPVGKPTREAEVLFRPDSVDDKDAFWLLGSANEQSEFLKCNGSYCSDMALLQLGKQEAFRKASIEHVFHSARDDASFAGDWLGLKGQLSMVRGYTYWMTTTRLCWAPTQALTAEVRVDTSSGYLVGAASDFGSDCDSSVDVFPFLAGHQGYWLATTGTFLREHAEHKLEERRQHAELGTDCAPANTPYSRDCAAAASCRTRPSSPYRRLLASSNVVIQTLGNEAALGFEKTPSLERVPGLLAADDAFGIGMMRLLLMALASAVAYVRRSQESSDSVSMLLRSWGRVLDRERPVMTHTMMSVFLDAAIGILGIGSRTAVVAVMARTLLEDGLGAVVVAETVGCAASALHFVLRHSLELNIKKELPITKLGGSMALLDSAAAILVSFADPPAFGSHHLFAGLGRLLATLLLCISGIPLAVFAAVSCGLLAGGLTRNADFFYVRGYVRMLWLSIGLWIAQLTTVGVGVAHVFCRVFAFQIFRVYPGGQALMTLLLFGTCFLLSVPTTNRTILEVAREIRGAGKEK